MFLGVGVRVCVYTAKHIFVSFRLLTEFLFNSNMLQQKYLLKFPKHTFKIPCKEVILGENYKQIKS